MFGRFNRHRFQSLKLPELEADMVLHGWFKFWAQLPEWLSKFEELKVANFTRCYMDTKLSTGTSKIERILIFDRI